MPKHYENEKIEVPKEAPKEAPKKSKKSNPWMVHLKKVRASNKGMSLKEAMKKAKETYKK
jgi:hypothetical protein